MSRDGGRMSTWSFVSWALDRHPQNAAVSIWTCPQSNRKGWPGLLNHIFSKMAAGCSAGRRPLGRYRAILASFNVSRHKAKRVQEWFEEHSNESEVSTWPPNYPDLHQIEHLWDVLDDDVMYWILATDPSCCLFFLALKRRNKFTSPAMGCCCHGSSL